MNVGRFIMGGVIPILFGGGAFVFRVQMARAIDRANVQMYGRTWLKMRGKNGASPNNLILPAIGSIAIGIFNILQSFP